MDKKEAEKLIEEALLDTSSDFLQALDSAKDLMMEDVIGGIGRSFSFTRSLGDGHQETYTKSEIALSKEEHDLLLAELLNTYERSSYVAQFLFRKNLE